MNSVFEYLSFDYYLNSGHAAATKSDVPREVVSRSLMDACDVNLDVRVRIKKLCTVLNETKDNETVYEVMWKTANGLIDELIQKANGFPNGLNELNLLCETHNISIRPFFRVKDLPYADSESVHVFMDDTMQIVAWLVETYECTQFDKPFEHLFFEEVEECKHYVYYNYQLIEILAFVMDYIKKSEHEKELLNILRIEMDEAVGSCVSGHLSAMINCLYGFPGVPNVVDNKFEHEKSTMFHFFNTHLDLFDLDGLYSSIVSLFRDGKLTASDNTADILKAYTGVSWYIDSISGLPAVWSYVR